MIVIPIVVNVCVQFSFAFSFLALSFVAQQKVAPLWNLPSQKKNTIK
jgi:hypothetical protein